MLVASPMQLVCKVVALLKRSVIVPRALNPVTDAYLGLQLVGILTTVFFMATALVGPR